MTRAGINCLLCARCQVHAYLGPTPDGSPISPDHVNAQGVLWCPTTLAVGRRVRRAALRNTETAVLAFGLVVHFDF